MTAGWPTPRGRLMSRISSPCRPRDSSWPRLGVPQADRPPDTRSNLILLLEQACGTAPWRSSSLAASFGDRCWAGEMLCRRQAAHFHEASCSAFSFPGVPQGGRWEQNRRSTKYYAQGDARLTQGSITLGLRRSASAAPSLVAGVFSRFRAFSRIDAVSSTVRPGPLAGGARRRPRGRL